MRLFIVSGRSGAGKSIALGVLEDLGFYCVDNLPMAFLPELVKLSSQDCPDIEPLIRLGKPGATVTLWKN